MYCEYFGFSERPFDVTPDPRFLYLSSAHREMLASLIYGIRERRGFITIVGEVGTGKTTLLNAMLDKLDKTIKVAMVFNTTVTFEQMLHLALIDLGLVKAEDDLSKVAALQILNDYAIKELSEGNNIVIVVDEAQNLDSQAMENFRLLSNLETRKHKLIQIILSGQPELDVKLRRKELRQLAQRINLRRYITPLDQEEMGEYIKHRLTVAGYKGKSVFSQKALQAVWEFSGGIPRKINVICDNAFLIAYGLERKKITGSIVDEAINDLSWSPYVQNESETEVSKPDLPTIFNVEPERKKTGPAIIPAPVFGKDRRSKSHGYSRIAKFVIIICFGLAIGFAFGKFMPNGKSGVDSMSADLKTSETFDADNGIQSTAGGQNDEFRIAKGTNENENQKLSMTKKPNMGGSSLEKPMDEESKISEGFQSSTEKVQPIPNENKMANVDISEPPEEYKADTQKQMRYRVVKQSDLLSAIIKEEYGTFNDLLLAKILESNPEIRNPDEIYVGQVIAIPDLQNF
jgi:general secretion pathway protein A